VAYCDEQMTRDYKELQENVKKGFAKLSDDNLNGIHIQYLYARSFFKQNTLAPANAEAVKYYEEQANKFWQQRSEYEQGMLALWASRNANESLVKPIVKSLKEKSLNNDEMGMYWKYPTGYWWYQAPIETHALMIEVFNEAAKDAQATDDLRTWLLKNKQTNAWKSTKATASAIYALLMSGDDWLKQNKTPTITVGGQPLAIPAAAQVGSGYFKVDFDKTAIKKEMATIEVKNNNNIVAWGSVYWQYFEKMDKIKPFADTPLKLSKELYIENSTAKGKELMKLSDKARLKVGDKVKMRIVMTVDRDMEFVHLKDGRGATMEPTNTLSGYRYQHGLGYYEETRDASTNFFFDYLRKGTYVFEYPLTIQHRGEFSVGIATIQSMYAPEFSSHSEGVRIVVE
jgi:Bacterial Alpha-2-macroglobulin MG10 domain